MSKVNALSMIMQERNDSFIHSFNDSFLQSTCCCCLHCCSSASRSFIHVCDSYSGLDFRCDCKLKSSVPISLRTYYLSAHQPSLLLRRSVRDERRRPERHVGAVSERYQSACCCCCCHQPRPFLLLLLTTNNIHHGTPRSSFVGLFGPRCHHTGTTSWCLVFLHAVHFLWRRPMPFWTWTLVQRTRYERSMWCTPITVSNNLVHSFCVSNHYYHYRPSLWLLLLRLEASASTPPLPWMRAVWTPRRTRERETVKTCVNSKPADAKESAVESWWRRLWHPKPANQRTNSSPSATSRHPHPTWSLRSGITGVKQKMEPN